MGLLSRVFGTRPDESAVAAAHAPTYHHQHCGGGALGGVVDVADSPTFLAVLRTTVATLAEVLGEDVDRVTFHLSGRTPDRGPGGARRPWHQPASVGPRAPDASRALTKCQPLYPLRQGRRTGDRQLKSSTRARYPRGDLPP
jgi:hypothetical protein